MATWPATLPAPLVDGYGIEPVSQTVSTDMEVGSARVRRRSFAQVDMLPVQWSLSNDQMTVFRVWFSHPTGADGGAAWFSTSLLMGDGSARTVQARFAGNWKAGYVPHMRWQVRAMLEVRSEPMSEREIQNILLGFLEKDVLLLWSPTEQANVLASKIGPYAEFSATGVQYDESGTSLGVVPAIHGDKGVWCGPGYTNLFAGDPSIARSVTLTAKTYTLWCSSGSVSCSYGTATPSAPLTFVATAGAATFTPTGVTQWQLTATPAPMPYVLPGTTVASAAGTSGGNGIGFAMSAEMTAALSGACTIAAEVTMGVGSGDIANSTLLPVLAVKNSNTDSIYMAKTSTGTMEILKSYDGLNVAFLAKDYDRNERHLKIVQTNALGTQFRVGNKRIGIDSVIQWGNWSNFDGSFNPLTHLRLAFGSTVPIWIKRVMVSNMGGMSDSQIEERINA